jgi:alcohol dehydrogenase YqhD (iron-dependent ADH family)
MNNFIYNTPTKVFFGKNEEDKLGQILKSYNIKKVLLHYGTSSIKKSGLYDKVVNQLNKANISFVELGGVTPNPKLSLALKGVELAKKENVDLILAVGGGSVIDSAKLIAVGAKVDFNPWLFSIHEKTPTNHIPVGVILTLSAAGSDMSSSCVITNEETKEKRGFNSEQNRPLFAILNPELTYTVSKFQTGCGIVDIMMHTLERYFSEYSNTPLTDNLALGLLKAVLDAGRIAISDPTNYNARATLMWANSLSHNGLTSCGKKFVMSVHQLEHEVSGMFDEVAHGAGLAVLWPAWAILACEHQPEKFQRFACEVMGIEKTDDPLKDARDGVKALKEYFKEIGMPTSMNELNIDEKYFKELAYNFTFKGTRILDDIIAVNQVTAHQILKLTNI